MAIAINVDVMLAKRKMQSKELANKIGITPRNFSLLKTGKAKAIRLSTLNSICEALLCQPGDILEFIAEDEVDVSEALTEAETENHDADTEEKRVAATVEKPALQMNDQKKATEAQADSTNEKPTVEVSEKVKKVVKKMVKKKIPSSVKPTVSPTEAAKERTGTNDSG